MSKQEYMEHYRELMSHLMEESEMVYCTECFGPSFNEVCGECKEKLKNEVA